MRLRVVTAMALGCALSLPVSGAHASDTVLDGKRTKVIKTMGSGGMQRHDDDPGRPSSGSEVCERRGCSTVGFVYQPATGVRGGLRLSSTWKDPLQDIDLYLVHVDKYGVWSEVAACVGPGSTAETIYVPPSALKPGARYVMVIDQQLSLNDIVTSKAEINVASDTDTKGCLSSARPATQLQGTSGPAQIQGSGGSAQVQDTSQSALSGTRMPFWRSLALFVGGLLLGAGLVLASVLLLRRRPQGGDVASS